MTHEPTLLHDFEQREFRDALGSFATGVCVLTARGDDGRYTGLTINSFNSVSLDPPLVLWSLSNFYPFREVFERCTHYAINVLSAAQEDLSRHFAVNRADQFQDLEFDVGTGGAPLLPGCSAWFECHNEFRYPGGDHVIFVGRVVRMGHAPHEPLLYFRGRYRELKQDI